MLTEQKYVSLSLELHLYFARIMKEHAIFLEAGFTPRNSNYSAEAGQYKFQFENVLMQAVNMASGVISEEIIASREISTDYTLGSEEKTWNFTGIPIDTNITIMQSRLYGGSSQNVSGQMVMYIKQLNKAALTLLSGLINFKTRILNSVLSCSMFTMNYPLLIEHIIREAKLYQRLVRDLENGKDINDENMKETMLFWDRIMMEHALFIRGLLDPTENALISSADSFAKEYEALLKEAQGVADAAIESARNKSLAETEKFMEFKEAGTRGIAECKIRSVILPLLADHVLREANHYIRLLNS